MPLYELSVESLTALKPTRLADRAFREREDLQRHLKANIAVLGDDLLVIAEEFSQWEDSRRRIDLLAIDRTGSLVVIELKRTEDGGHMELQAVRYAAMVSTLTFAQAVAALADLQQIDVSEAEQSILKFLLVSPNRLESFARTVRILLVSPDFSKELTTAVLWLNSNGLDIRCIRLRPYALESRTLLEVDQIIPLREAAGYLVQMKQKECSKRAEAAAESTVDFTRYDLTVNGGKNLSPPVEAGPHSPSHCILRSPQVSHSINSSRSFPRGSSS